MLSFMFYIFKICNNFYVVICIIVNLCLFTDKYTLFFRRYCNKNNTFPNTGHLEPLKISFNSSSEWFYAIVDTESTDKPAIQDLSSPYSSVSFVVSQKHSV